MMLQKQQQLLAAQNGGLNAQDPRLFLAGLNHLDQNTIMNFQAQLQAQQNMMTDNNGLHANLAMSSALNSDLIKANPQDRIFDDEEEKLGGSKTSSNEDGDGTSIVSNEDDDSSDINPAGGEEDSSDASYESENDDEKDSQENKFEPESDSPGKEDNGESQIEKYAEKLNQIEKKLEESAKETNGIEDKDNIKLEAAQE